MHEVGMTKMEREGGERNQKKRSSGFYGRPGKRREGRGHHDYQSVGSGEGESGIPARRGYWPGGEKGKRGD